MNKTLATWATITGFTVTILIYIMHFIFDVREQYMESVIYGYAVMFLSTALIYFGIKAYREKEMGGVIGFGKALMAGTMMSFMAALIFGAATWLILGFLTPEYTSEMFQMQVEQYEINGNEEALQDLKASQTMYESAVFHAGIMFVTLFLIYFFASTIFAFLLKKPGVPSAVRDSGSLV